MPDFDKYLQLQAKVGFLENVSAFLAAEIAVSLAQLEDDNRMFRVYLPAADGVFLDHDQVYPLQVFIK